MNLFEVGGPREPRIQTGRSRTERFSTGPRAEPDQDHHRFETWNWTGLGSRKISKPWTGPRKNSKSLTGPVKFWKSWTDSDQSLDLAIRGSLGGPWWWDQRYFDQNNPFLLNLNSSHLHRWWSFVRRVDEYCIHLYHNHIYFGIKSVRTEESLRKVDGSMDRVHVQVQHGGPGFYFSCKSFHFDYLLRILFLSD